MNQFFHKNIAMYNGRLRTVSFPATFLADSFMLVIDFDVALSADLTSIAVVFLQSLNPLFP